MKPNTIAHWMLSRVHNADRHIVLVGDKYTWSLTFFWQTLASGVEQTRESCERALDGATAQLLREVAAELEK